MSGKKERTFNDEEDIMLEKKERLDEYEYCFVDGQAFILVSCVYAGKNKTFIKIHALTPTGSIDV